jgi:hypothetical protein
MITRFRSRTIKIKKRNSMWQTLHKNFRSFTEFKIYFKALLKENKKTPLSDSQWTRIWRRGLGL